MRAVRPLIQAVADSGIAREAFLRAAQLDPDCESAPDTRLPRHKLFQLFELAVALTQDAAFGLHSMEALTSEAVSPIGALVMHAATLRDALRSLQEFRCIFSNEPSFRLQEKDGKVSVRCRSHPEASPVAARYLSEIAVAGLYLVLRRFGASRVDFVAFAYPAPDYQLEYARLFAGHARFEQPFTGLCFDAALLDNPAPHVDSDLHAALSVYARRRVRQLTVGQSWAERVHEQLVWQRAPRDMSMGGVARKLGVSTRTLRRHLANEQKSYVSIVTGALAVIAKNCLLDEQRTIMETAYELGFSDNTAFHRAFKRWTGLTPAAYRRAQSIDKPAAIAGLSQRDASTGSAG
jgi:AraC-like DNA-binding protein